MQFTVGSACLDTPKLCEEESEPRTASVRKDEQATTIEAPVGEET